MLTLLGNSIPYFQIALFFSKYFGFDSPFSNNSLLSTCIYCTSTIEFIPNYSESYISLMLFVDYYSVLYKAIKFAIDFFVKEKRV